VYYNLLGDVSQNSTYDSKNEDYFAIIL